MHFKNLCTIVAATAAFTFAGVVSGQDQFTWKGGSGEWKDDGNWTCVGCSTSRWPGELTGTIDDDLVAIPSGFVELDLKKFDAEEDVKVGRIVIESGAELHVFATADDYSLIVAASGGSADGSLTVEPEGFMFIEALVEVEGTVRIKADAEDDAGIISVDDADAVFTMKGQLIIEATDDDDPDLMGFLNIQEGQAVLEKDGDHFIGGQIFISRLDDLATLRITNDSAAVKFKPYEDTGPTLRYGEFRGFHNTNASILLDEDVEVENWITFAGAMKVDGDGGTATLKLVSTGTTGSGVVHANLVNGTLAFGANLILDDDCMGDTLWIADAEGAVLEFNRGATLSGDFVLDHCPTSPATIRVMPGNIVSTEGNLSPFNGIVDASDTAPSFACFVWVDGTQQQVCNTTRDECP